MSTPTLPPGTDAPPTAPSARPPAGAGPLPRGAPPRRGFAGRARCAAVALALGLWGLLLPTAAWAQGSEAALRERVAELEAAQLELRSRVLQLEERLEGLIGESATAPIHDIPVGDSPVRGNPAADLTLIVFGDYQSAYSTRAEHAIQRLLETYPNALRVVHKHYPLRTRHPQAHDAALAAIAAQRQGRFWEMHEQLYRASRELSPTLYPVLARQIGLDLLRFDRDRTSLWALERLDADERAAVAASVDGVPALFLNGRRLMTWRYDYLQGEIDKMLPQNARR